ncbi:MAG: ABC transporter ATP-binding protein [Planctomycetes bacterium]|nr:ABC transporter ATP-binding protein [Planctomycetota bacterium]
MSNDPSVLYSARNIRKEYRLQGISVPVLKGLHLQIRRGEILSIVGLSGVGKSTLLNILGLLDSPSSGELIYQGRRSDFHGQNLARLDIQDKSRVRNREFGFVFQFYHLLPDLDVLENVMLPAMILLGVAEYRARKPQIVERARSLLERVGILERQDFPPSRLSGGERQRAAIARALMNDPELVFCDEPTGNLDTVTGHRIHGLILELNRDLGTGFVLVTHDRGLSRLAHRTLAMRDGLFASPS